MPKRMPFTGLKTLQTPKSLEGMLGGRGVHGLRLAPPPRSEVRMTQRSKPRQVALFSRSVA